MKRNLTTFIFVALFAICANAQSDIVGGGGKVKKEKNLRCGVEAYLGAGFCSIDGYEVKNGKAGADLEANFIIAGPLKPSNPEGRWYGEMSIGFGFFSETVESEKQSSYSSYEEDISIYELFKIGVKAKYLLNPLATRGKWFIGARLSCCPLVCGLPTFNDSSISGRSHRYLGSSSSMGLDSGLGLSASYEMKHFGIGIEAFGKLMSPYSDSESSAIDAMYGVRWDVKYIF